MANPADILIRDAVADDLPVLDRLAPKGATHADRLRAADPSGMRFLVVQQIDTLIGYGLLVLSQPPTWPEQRLFPLMVDLFIHPAWRCRGVGTALIRFMEQTARERGFSRIYLSVNREEKNSAYRLYERLGYAALQADPYRDHWRYTDSRGVVHEGEEWLIDMGKDLAFSPGQVPVDQGAGYDRAFQTGSYG